MRPLGSATLYREKLAAFVVLNSESVTSHINDAPSGPCKTEDSNLKTWTEHYKLQPSLNHTPSTSSSWMSRNSGLCTPGWAEPEHQRFGRSHAVADPGFAKGGGANHGERAEREPKRGSGGGARCASLNGGLGAEPPAGSRGRAPGGGSGGRSPPEAESFLYIFTQKSGQN